MALKHRRHAFLMCHSAFIFFVFVSVVPHMSANTILLSSLRPRFPVPFLVTFSAAQARTYKETRAAKRGTHSRTNYHTHTQAIKLVFLWLRSSD